MDLSNREGRQAFYLSNEWRQLRKYKLSLNPFCEDCLKKGKVKAAKHVHHIVDLVDDNTLALEYTNLRSLCIPCHSRTTASHKTLPSPSITPDFSIFSSHSTPTK